MEKEVIVYIKGIQQQPGSTDAAQQDVQELYVKGVCYQRRGKWYVFYEEETGADAPPVRCALRFTAEELVVNRQGQMESSLTLRAQEKTQNRYCTTAGMMALGCETNEYRLQETKEALRLYAAYRLELNGIYVSDNRIEICIRPSYGTEDENMES